MLAFGKIFSSGAVLQQDTPNEIFGYAPAGNEVAVKLLKSGAEIFSGTVRADESGRWSAEIPPVKGGNESYELLAESGGEKVSADDIVFGELFHISGQSNMELPMRRTRDPFRNDPAPEEYPYIREFRVPIKCRFSAAAAEDDFSGGVWKSAAGENIPEMSAAGYYFAEDIHKRLGVPVGLVNTAAGGAMLESFMPYDMIRGYGIHNDFLDKATKENYIGETTKRDNERLRAWTDSLGNEDFGLVPSDGMKSCVLPNHFEDIDGLMGFSGRLFFFRKFTLPEDFPLSGAELILGTVVDSDTAYINGVKVGETGYMYPPRYYPVPDGVLKRGENILAVRVDVSGGSGGFTKGRRLCIKSDARTLSLAGEWKYAVAAKTEKPEAGTFFQGLPLALYADMMRPAMRYKYRALLWYQGESNCGNAGMYRRMFGDFVENYRKVCGYDIPVIFTQLCRHEGMCGYDPSGSWAKFRQAQLECLDIPNTAMAVTFDAGEYNDLHPTDKRTVGKRLAYCAGGLLYGDETVFVRCTEAKPVPSESGTEISLSFDGYICLKNDSVSEFAIVFEDGVYGCERTAPQKCGKTLLIRSPHKGKPVSVRYAYRNSPDEPELYDLEMKPVSPFEISITWEER